MHVLLRCTDSIEEPSVCTNSRHRWFAMVWFCVETCGGQSAIQHPKAQHVHPAKKKDTKPCRYTMFNMLWYRLEDSLDHCSVSDSRGMQRIRERSQTKVAGRGAMEKHIRLFILGWRPSPLGWRPSLVGWWNVVKCRGVFWTEEIAGKACVV